jgi:uncharacterized membrane protein
MIRSIFGSFGMGALAAYFLDPVMGRRRRSLLRDKTICLFSRAEHWTDAALRDLGHRAQGLLAEAVGWVAGGEVSDRVLEERVRSRLGRACSHPGSIEVRARDGKVVLSGVVLRSEAAGVVVSVRKVRGVRSVENRLEIHREAGDEPGLQGGKGRPAHRWELFQANWAPGTRLVMGAIGCTLYFDGASRKGVGPRLTSAAGLAIFLRSFTNLPLSRLVGLGAGRRAVDLRKTIHLRAPVEKVFRFWRRVEDFPSFMAHVREVRSIGPDRFHCSVDGPAGIPIRWNMVITREEPNRILAWKTEPGSIVGHAGLIRFDPDGDGTRVGIRMCYNPPAGAIGDWIAGILGSDPKSRLDEDLVRMKTLIETGRPPHDAARKGVPVEIIG